MSPHSKPTLGAVAKAARLRAELGLRQAAKKIGVSPSHLSRVENDLEMPSGRVIARMADAYSIPTESLTVLAEKPKASTAAHGHALQASPELRALYRLGATLDATEVEDLIRRILTDRNFSSEDIEKQLASLKDELLRLSNGRDEGLFAAEARPRFLSKRQITQIADEILARNGLTQETYVPPTPIELLADSEPGIIYRIDELECRSNGEPLVLGKTGWNARGDRQIVINRVLAESDRSYDEHRFNFTLGHELFHAIEHLPRLPKAIAAPLTRLQLGENIFVDRKLHWHGSAAERAVNAWARRDLGGRQLMTQEDWREWQSNYFSAALLAPEWAVVPELERRIGEGIIEVKEGENPRDVALSVAGENEFESGRRKESLAELFAVSRQAMAVRLLGLGLVKEVRS
jgi:transcriptional regulator with XRE-family HTH domain/Zn-dependent peptidase ImmA (M78 family)